MGKILKIYDPIDLTMLSVEYDTYLPSVKTIVSLKILHPTGSFSYEANDIWFTQSEWIKFTQNIGNKENASLKDMSDFFEFSVEHRSEGYILNLRCKEPNVFNQTILQHTCPISIDELDRLNSSFENAELEW